MVKELNILKIMENCSTLENEKMEIEMELESNYKKMEYSNILDAGKIILLKVI